MQDSWDCYDVWDEWISSVSQVDDASQKHGAASLPRKLCYLLRMCRGLSRLHYVVIGFTAGRQSHIYLLY